jgi:pimeloyl-ACP methyl ester carboxylesterase
VVFAPTLTGLSDRAHLLTRHTGLDDHVRDVTSLLTTEGLGQVVLVGHSYGGMVVTAVAAANPELVERLVIVDGFVPEAGQSAMQILPERASAHYRQLARDEGDGWLIPVSSATRFGVTDEAVAARITSQLTDQPLKTFEDLSRADAGDIGIPASFLLCAGWSRPFRPSAERALGYGWTVREVPADHEIMITAPALLAQFLTFGT